MTNHWADIDNASLVLVMGANPSENHPACMGHVNAARYDALGRGRKAKLVVVDPRYTRTAQQADLYVRIRPGTDIAFLNGLLNYILNQPVGSTFRTRLEAWLNSTSANHYSAARTFVDDGGTTRTLSVAELATATYATAGAATGFSGGRAWPKYCDARLKVAAGAAPTDYQRDVLRTASWAAGTPNDWQFSNMPVLAANIDDADCVFQKLRTHVAHYTDTIVADICGCKPTDIAAVGNHLIANSRMMSSDFDASLCTPSDPGYKAATFLYAMGQTQHTYGSQNIKDIAILMTLLGNMGRPGGGVNALRGIHNVQGSTDFGNLYDGIPGYYKSNPDVYTSGTTSDALKAWMNVQFGNRIATATNTGGKDVYDPGALGLQQRGFYNMTRSWFGDTTTSSAPFRTKTDVKIKLGANGYTSLGNNAIVAGSVTLEPAADGSLPAYVEGTDFEVDYAGGRVKRLNNAIPEKTDVYITYRYAAYDPADFDKLYELWPKGNGLQHISAIREMVAGNIEAAVVWGQNPAITEPNQSKVREGFKRLKLLVCVDMFANETAEVTRRVSGDFGEAVDGVTYLLPACSHVEEAGSVTHSGRWIQWRDRATAPKGNSKADIELLLRFAKALDGAGCFGHITSQWNTMSVKPVGSAFDILYAKYGWDGVVPFEAMTGTSVDNAAIKGSEIVAEKVFKDICQPLPSGGTMWIYAEAYNTTKASARPAGLGTPLAVTDEAVVLKGYEAVKLSRAAISGTPVVRTAAGGVGTLLVADVDYTLDKALGTIVYKAGTNVGTGDTVYVSYTGRPRRDWTMVNRAKSRLGDPTLDAYTALNYPRYGFAWLLNRRVFYNNSEVPDDEGDVFVAPGVMARLFTIHSNTTAEWSLLYRSYNTFKDMPSKGLDATLDKSDANAPHKYAGRFPGHTEPIETPRRDLANKYGRNRDVVTPIPLVKDDTKVAMWSSLEASKSYTDGIYDVDGNATRQANWKTDAKDFPLVLTTIRCVEHFQGGPITRNNSWNVEAEPVPWIEINSLDAAAKGIKDGDWVNVVTARSNSGSDQEGRSRGTGWALGFKARVGYGLQSNQRVAQGVVAIPWHWGDKGLSTGSRANDLCIDAFDSNTTIPEYKACLCRIEKM